MSGIMSYPYIYQQSKTYCTHLNYKIYSCDKDSMFLVNDEHLTYSLSEKMKIPK